MDTAAGRPARFGSEDFPLPRTLIIADTLQNADPREAITRLLAELEGVEAPYTKRPASAKAAAFTSTRRRPFSSTLSRLPTFATTPRRQATTIFSGHTTRFQDALDLAVRLAAAH
jgi:hypothetical protein